MMAMIRLLIKISFFLILCVFLFIIIVLIIKKYLNKIKEKKDMEDRLVAQAMDDFVFDSNESNDSVSDMSSDIDSKK